VTQMCGARYEVRTKKFESLCEAAMAKLGRRETMIQRWEMIVLCTVMKGVIDSLTVRR
jgi:hypothetical protein